MKFITFFLLFFLTIRGGTFAQHEGHQKMNTPEKKDQVIDVDSMPEMSHAYSRNLPMNRNSSGTAWQPDASSMYGYMLMKNGWGIMLHGSIFFRYNHQGINTKNKRADSLTDHFDVPNWFMIMAQRKIKSKGLLAFTGMFSADELFMAGNGYPLLFQSGETFQDKPLVDRQHPHDLISGLSIGYTHLLDKNSDLTVYLGYPGEPAIGPPAFMHRLSTFNNPDAPLGHHWQDATHISFGVATIGYRYKILKFEASCFTGREPDENRYDFDKPRFDSYSYRVSTNLNDNFSVQISQGFLKSPETLEAEENVTRSTASIMHSHILSEKSHLSSSLIWGMNQKSNGSPEHSVLLESNLQMNKFALYGKCEFIEKSASEIQLLKFDQHKKFLINLFSLGSNYNLLSFKNTNLKAGVQGSINLIEKELVEFYGNTPLSIQLYLRLIPFNTNVFSIHSNNNIRKQAQHNHD